MTIPRIGQVVHYHAISSPTPCAAMVTGIPPGDDLSPGDGSVLSLAVFAAGRLRFIEAVRAAPAPTPGRWTWMPHD